MPREYRTTQPGTPALSPLQFGSEGLNLQTPQYQAQTNVEKPEDIFGQLQQMLGMGVNLVNMMNQQKTQDIKNKLSYDSFVQQQKDRADADKARADSDKAEIIRAHGTMELERLQAANDTPGIRAFRDARLEDKPDASTPEVFADALLGGQATSIIEGNEAEARVEASRAKNELSKSDHDKVIDQYAPRLQALSRHNDQEGLEMAEKELLERQGRTDNPDEKKAYLALLGGIEVDLRRISSNNEETALRDEYAVLGELQKYAVDALNPLVDKLKEDPEFLSKIGAISGGARRAAIHDSLVDAAVRTNQGRLVDILQSSGSSPKEISTVMDVLRVKTDELMDAASRQGDNDRKQAAIDKTVSAASFYVGIGDIDAADAAILGSDAPMSENAKATHLHNNAVEFLSVANPAIRRARISELLSKDNPAHTQIARAAEREMIRTANIESAAERSALIQKPVALGEPLQPHGWVALYKDRHDMDAAQFHHRLGVNIDDPNYVMTRPELEFMTKLHKEWQQDINASGLDNAKMNNLLKAEDRRARQTISSNDIFDESVLGRAIASEDWGRYSHAELVQLVDDSSVGYRDRIIPTKLIAAVTNHLDDPMGQRLARAFFHEHTPLTSPQLSVILGENKDMRRAYMGSVYANQLLRAQTDPQVVDARTGDFIRSIASLDPLDPARETPEGRKILNEFNKAINNIANGEGFWDKYTKDAYKNMPQGQDKALFATFAAMATAMGALNPAKMAAELMVNEGYVFTTTASGPIDVVYNGPDRDGNRALPDNETLRSALWKEYMDSRAPLALEAKSANLRKRGLPDLVLDKSEVVSVVLAPTPTGLDQGYSEVALRIGSQTEYIHPLLMNVSAAGFSQWVKERRPASVQQQAGWSVAEDMLSALPGEQHHDDQLFNLYNSAPKPTYNAKVFENMRYDNPRRKTPVVESKLEGRKDPTR